MQVPVEMGMHVELHSLSRDDLNGRCGEALAWDPAKERWAVHLVGGEKMAVRPINLKRAPPAAADVHEEAFAYSEEATGVLAAIRQGKGNPAQLFQRAEALLAKAEQLDPAMVTLHQARGDAAHMQGRFAEQAKHARRAVANGHGLVASDGCNHQNQRRMALAAALGNAGDLEGEIEQVRAVLAAEPGHVHARLTLGQSLLDRGEFEAAVPCPWPCPWPCPYPYPWSTPTRTPTLTLPVLRAGRRVTATTACSTCPSAWTAASRCLRHEG